MADERTEIPVEVDGRTLTMGNLEKVMYPRTGTTKGEVLNYYARVAPVLLPHLADRAVTRIRWPHGTGDMHFFEKNAPGGTPSWLRTVTVPTSGCRTSGEEGELVFPVIDDLADPDLAGEPRLPRAARAPVDGRQATAARRTPTGWSSTSTRATRRGWGSAAGGAAGARPLEDDGLACAPVTSGSKGLHVYAALPGKRTYERSATTPRRSPRSSQPSTRSSWSGR